MSTEGERCLVVDGGGLRDVGSGAVGGGRMNWNVRVAICI